MEWLPYKTGDTLIFRSNTRHIDTILITEVNSYFNPKDHLSLFAKKYQTLFVSGISWVSESDKEGNRHNKIEKNRIELLSMYADEKAKIKFHFNKIGDSLSVPETLMLIDHIKVESTQTFEYGNYWKIQAQDYLHERDYDLLNFWWSKEFGYVRYEFNNGTYWKLDKFIRKGKNILEEEKN